MESVLLFSPETVSLEMVHGKLIGRFDKVSRIPAGDDIEVQVQDEDDRALIGTSLEELKYFAKDELSALPFAPVSVLGIAYSSIPFLARILRLIANDESTWIDNAFGMLVSVPELLGILRENPEWDWRADAWREIKAEVSQAPVLSADEVARYSAMRDGGGTAVQVCLAAAEGGLDSARRIVLLRRLFGLSLREAADVNASSTRTTS
jgi:hypothetical protein